MSNSRTAVFDNPDKSICQTIRVLSTLAGMEADSAIELEGCSLGSRGYGYIWGSGHYWRVKGFKGTADRGPTTEPEPCTGVQQSGTPAPSAPKQRNTTQNHINYRLRQRH